VSVKGSATVKSVAVVSIPVSDQERAKAYRFAGVRRSVANSLAGTVWLLRPKQIAVAAATSPDAACCEATA
jgi:hypothetical protein